MVYIIGIVTLIFGLIIGFLAAKLTINKEKFELVQLKEQIKTNKGTSTKGCALILFIPWSFKRNNLII